MKKKNPSKIHIIGIGNLTRLDDGIAIHILDELRKEIFPETVKISDLGTGGIDIALALDDWSFGIIIDAVKIENLHPGELIEFEISDDVLPDVKGLSSSHGFDALSALKLAYSVSDFNLPEKLVIIGVQVEQIDGFGTDISPKVQEAIPKVIAKIHRLIKDFSLNYTES
ncbi:MAG: hydrogenase maturation protease [Candidatus Heimdallarchaeota archaeon]